MASEIEIQVMKKVSRAQEEELALEVRASKLLVGRVITAAYYMPPDGAKEIGPWGQQKGIMLELDDGAAVFVQRSNDPNAGPGSLLVIPEGPGGAYRATLLPIIDTEES